MANHDGVSDLPRVEESDLSFILFEDITDPSHRARFERFAESNPVLAKEVIRRAQIDSRQTKGSIDITSAIINAVSFTIDALSKAVERESETIDVVYDEDQQRSIELDGDQPAA